MDAIGIHSSMKDEWKCGKPLLGGRAITIHDYKLVVQAHHYVLKIQPLYNLLLSKCHICEYMSLKL